MTTQKEILDKLVVAVTELKTANQKDHSNIQKILYIVLAGLVGARILEAVPIA